MIGRSAGTSGKNFEIQTANSKTRVTIHGTIQIQQLLFKFVALFKISGTIQIRNMNSARALQLSGSGTQILFLFYALCRALLAIMQNMWHLIMVSGCSMGMRCYSAIATFVGGGRVRNYYAGD